MNKRIGRILKPLTEATDVVILSGAGLSADSGIPTFRDGPDGLWAHVDPEEVVSLDGFTRNPEKVWAWHESMRILFAEVTPNLGHVAIAALEWLLPNARLTVITQNIDGLHQIAGSERVFEIHGSTLRVRCHHHCGFIGPWHAVQRPPRQCPACGAPARPDVVWFGETLDRDLFALAVRTTLAADIFFTVGTSSIVQPAASLTQIAKENGALVVEVNPHPTPCSEIADHSFRARATEFFPALQGALSLGHAS